MCHSADNEAKETTRKNAGVEGLLGFPLPACFCTDMHISRGTGRRGDAFYTGAPDVFDSGVDLALCHHSAA